MEIWRKDENKRSTLSNLFLILPKIAFAENCGNPVYARGMILTWFDKTFNDGKNTQAAEVWYACYQRNLPDPNIEFKAIESCKQIIRRITPLPSTISFATAYPPIGNTEGGYSVRVGGKSAAGDFFVTCHLDQSFKEIVTRQ